MPKMEDIQRFENDCWSIQQMIENNTAENSKPAGIRDTLLPKLMSGELDVSSIDL